MFQRKNLLALNIAISSIKLSNEQQKTIYSYS